MQQANEAVVHIVDNDADVRTSLLQLAGLESIEAHAYESAEAFLSRANMERPGCIVLDIRMPGMSGIELLKHLRLNLNDIPVLLISGHADVPATVRGMKLGAVDLLQKPVDPEAFIESVRRCLEVSQAQHRDRRETKMVDQRFSRLTPRELELLGLIVVGRSNKQIALHLGISIKTVANHRASLMTKTGASNAADIARLFMIHAAGPRVEPPRLIIRNIPN